ncbi:hypothetical protein ECEC1864_3135 [Escherichia coli EC1864]|nr:hypothetical protein ECEC1864_3135 [Escherichia coli EC1864]
MRRSNSGCINQTPAHTDVQPFGASSTTSVPGVERETERSELDNQLNSSRNCNHCSGKG